ncbi:hypothetical protein [Bradyrhizobium sp. LA2.1]|uniref:hypothetical protein n=1 Tax=Bradyrhizobium sp. LA2.1 TaxID=3156376 RepID=UPI0033975A0B
MMSSWRRQASWKPGAGLPARLQLRTLKSIVNLDGPEPAKPNMRKAQIVVLIILFSCFAYLGITGEGRARIIAVVTAIVFAAVAYGSFLQEQMYRKALRPGASIFSLETMFRATLTREFLYSIVLFLGLLAFVGFIIAMDELGQLQ